MKMSANHQVQLDTKYEFISGRFLPFSFTPSLPLLEVVQPPYLSCSTDSYCAENLSLFNKTRTWNIFILLEKSGQCQIHKKSQISENDSVLLLFFSVFQIAPIPSNSIHRLGLSCCSQMACHQFVLHFSWSGGKKQTKQVSRRATKCWVEWLIA